MTMILLLALLADATGDVVNLRRPFNIFLKNESRFAKRHLVVDLKTSHFERIFVMASGLVGNGTATMV